MKGKVFQEEIERLRKGSPEEVWEEAVEAGVIMAYRKELSGSGEDSLTS